MQTSRKAVHVLLSAILLLGQLPNRPAASQMQDEMADPGSSLGPETAEAQVRPQPGAIDLPAGVSADWWTAAQANIRKAEYQVTWQEDTQLADAPAAWQAPNRAQNLRAYFTPGGPRLMPREFEAGRLPGNGGFPWWVTAPLGP